MATRRFSTLCLPTTGSSSAPTGEVDTKREQEKKIKDKSLVFEAIDPKEVNVRVHGDAAIVMGLYHIKATVNGKTTDGVFRNTGVFTKQAQRWRCVFNQVTPVAGPPAERSRQIASQTCYVVDYT